jgi:GH35 family endo-1,4-beta-xylanase
MNPGLIPRLRWLGLWCWAAAAGRGQTPLPPGDALLPPDAAPAFAVSHGDGATLGPVAAAGPGFAGGWQVQTLADETHGDAVDLRAPLARGLAAHQVALVRFYARALTTTDESGTGRVEVRLGGAEGVSAFEARVSFGREWQEFVLPFQAAVELPAGSAYLGLGFGFMRQTVQIGGVQLVAYGAAQRLEDLPRNRFTYAGREADAPWRREAQARIERIRKGDLHVRVVDAAGRPVPNARVEITEVNPEFQWGSALQFARLVHDSPENLIYRQKALELFNAASPENDLKWVTWAGDWGDAYTHEQALGGLRWLRDHGFHVRGHVLVWPGRRNLPLAVQALLGSPGQSRIPSLVDAHIREMAAATREYVEEWDTLNEPQTNHDLMDTFGRPIMAEWFQVAHAAMPAVRLYLNDFSNHDRTTDAAHVAAFAGVAGELQAAHAPLGGLGLQAHIDEQPNAPVEVLRVLDEYDRFHLPMRVTEFDIRTDDELLQADYTRDFLTLMFSHPSVIGFQVWGFWAGAHWRPSGAMYRLDWSEKPNGAVYRDLVHRQWRTRAAAPTGPDGRADLRGFYGDYTAAVTAGGRVAHARFALPSGAPPPTVTVTLPP